MAFELNPSNDLYLQTTLKTVNPTTQQITPLTSGVVEAFLATSNSPTATAADPTLTTTCTYSTTTKKWLIPFEGASLTPSLLASLFGSTTPYCIVTANSTDIRSTIELEYVASRAADQG